jgi:hypothetical protein
MFTVFLLSLDEKLLFFFFLRTPSMSEGASFDYLGRNVVK